MSLFDNGGWGAEQYFIVIKHLFHLKFDLTWGGGEHAPVAPPPSFGIVFINLSKGEMDTKN